jgi:hypothetical protein
MKHSRGGGVMEKISMVEVMEKIAMVEVLTGEQMVGLMKEEDASQALICPRYTSRPAPLCI